MMREIEILSEIEKNTYRIERKIGEGAYGEIFLAKEISTQRKVALKVTMFENEKEGSIRRVFNREVQIAKQLPAHPNIVQIKDDYLIGEEIGVIVMERMEMDLMEYILNTPKLSLKEMLFVFGEICNAVSFLHKNNVAHCDLKPENVLVNTENGVIREVKLCDFGFSVDWKNELRKSRRFGTEEYLCPEALFQNRIYEEKVDIWSLGVLFFVLMTGLFPFIKRNNATFALNLFNLHKMILSYKFDQTEANFEKSLEINVPQWIEMLQKIFLIDPLERPSMEQILNLPFLIGAKEREESQSMNTFSAIEDIENSSASRKTKKRTFLRSFLRLLK